MRGFAVIAEQGCRWGRGEAMSGRSTDGLCRTLSLGGAVCALAVGNAVVFPTDTVFGLGVSVSAAPGPQLLYDLKRRDAGKPWRGLWKAPRRWMSTEGTFPPMRGASPRPSGPAASRSWCAPPMPSPPPSNRPRHHGLRMPASEAALGLIRAGRLSFGRHLGQPLQGPPTRPASKISIARWWPAPPACTFPMIPVASAATGTAGDSDAPSASARFSAAIDWCHRPLLAPPPPCSTAPARPPASCARRPYPRRPERMPLMSDAAATAGRTEFTFDSADGRSQVRAVLWVPLSMERADAAFGEPELGCFKPARRRAARPRHGRAYRPLR